jgi:iron-sulfur cluster repair protein YtfE (RIC family)
MPAPLDAITVIHNAFRRDMTEIDEAAYKVAKHGGDLSPVLDRLQFHSQILMLHAEGEEDAVFPALEKVAPLVAKAYAIDHDELDMMTDGLEKIRGAPDELVAARATAGLWTHLRIHLYKEDVHLYPILRERITQAEQAPIVGHMASKTPPEMMPKFVDWIMRLLEQDDRETMTRVWIDLMPEEVFAGVKPLIRDSILAEDWAELTKRIPKLG